MWFDDQKHSVQGSHFCSPRLDSLGVLFECLRFPWCVLPALVIRCVVMCGFLSAPFLYLYCSFSKVLFTCAGYAHSLALWFLFCSCLTDGRAAILAA